MLMVVVVVAWSTIAFECVRCVSVCVGVCRSVSLQSTLTYISAHRHALRSTAASSVRPAAANHRNHPHPLFTQSVQTAHFLYCVHTHTHKYAYRYLRLATPTHSSTLSLVVVVGVRSRAFPTQIRCATHDCHHHHRSSHHQRHHRMLIY